MTTAPHHEVQVEALPTVGEVPEALQRFGLEHHREVVLVGAPEQLLVRHVGPGLRLGPGVDRSHQDEDEEAAGRPHVCTSGRASMVNRRAWERHSCTHQRGPGAEVVGAEPGPQRRSAIQRLTSQTSPQVKHADGLVRVYGFITDAGKERKTATSTPPEKAPPSLTPFINHQSLPPHELINRLDWLTGVGGA